MLYIIRLLIVTMWKFIIALNKKEPQLCFLLDLSFKNYRFQFNYNQIDACLWDPRYQRFQKDYTTMLTKSCYHYN